MATVLRITVTQTQITMALQTQLRVSLIQMLMAHRIVSMPIPTTIASPIRWNLATQMPMAYLTTWMLIPITMASMTV